MKIQNLLLIVTLFSVIEVQSAAEKKSAPPQYFARIVADVPDQRMKICANYRIHDNDFTIALYEAKVRKDGNLKNNLYVGYVRGITGSGPYPAYISTLHIIPEARDKKYGSLLTYLALQEFAERGFKNVVLDPVSLDRRKTEELKRALLTYGAKEKSGDAMEFDISELEIPMPESTENVIRDLMYYETFIHAAKAGDLKKVKQILNKQFNPKSKKVRFDINPNAREEITGMTALMYAAEQGHTDIVQYLITQAHADVNIKDAYGDSVLTIATRTSKDPHNLLKLLLYLSPFTPDIKQDAIAEAETLGREDVIKILASAQSRIKSKDFAKAIIDLPKLKMKICAHYEIKDNTFNISLYEAQVRKNGDLRNNQYVGQIRCMANIDTDFAHITTLYITPEAREKKYGTLLAHLALEEFALLGFKSVTFIPLAIDSVHTIALRNIYLTRGSKQKEGLTMHYDISALPFTAPEPFEDIFDSLIYYNREFIHAAKTGNLAKIKRLLNRQVDPESKKATFDINPNVREELTGMTALMYAAEMGHTDIVEYLLTQADANVNMQDSYGGPTLTDLIKKTRTPNSLTKLIQFLSKKSSTIRQTALDFARLSGHTDIVKALEAASEKSKPKSKKAKL